MLFDIVKNNNFRKLMQNHIEELIIFFFKNEQNFGILCKIDEISFEPELPDYIRSEFRPMTLFFLAGYTFETAHIDDDRLIFEAGFGSENIGSFVSVPLLSIMQIIIDETPIFVNLATYEKIKEESTAVKNDNGIKNSMEALLSNPENKKFKK
ncbi:hypothetical protein [Sulfurimonas sp. HSL-1716]|uniref:hypothetical protein n=1 Tax=Hydrocurvibacter sulfurireducens TaxID=3131937 RepID=UPI0031F7CA01